MRYHDYNRAENACRIGLALAIVAVILNSLSLYVLPGNQAFDIFGVVCAVVSMAAGYFADSLIDNEFATPAHDCLVGICLLACVASYLVWLLSFLF